MQHRLRSPLHPLHLPLQQQQGPQSVSQAGHQAAQLHVLRLRPLHPLHLPLQLQQGQQSVSLGSGEAGHQAAQLQVPRGSKTSVMFFCFCKMLILIFLFANKIFLFQEFSKMIFSINQLFSDKVNMIAQYVIFEHGREGGWA